MGARLLARWPRLANLRDLDLSRNEIGDEGAVALAESPHLTNLRRLSLTGNRITESGKRTLAGSPLYRHTALDLRDNWSALTLFRR